ncbi:2-oxoacid:acceptor oxidoreductase subunit alpha [Candidatus Woesearchaeota archaeon]|nr:2-oxoacid:acceptor oxidoreductase subunit alpha [Candidatus Woesearchaeota archaeon]
MEKNRVHWKIGGAAGQGVKSSGIIFAKTCTRGGLSAFGYLEYPSLIKGGHNTYQVRVEDRPVRTLVRQLDVLVALNRDTIERHLGELAPGAVVIYDGDRVKAAPVEFGRDDVRFLHVPALHISKELKVSQLMENQVFLGATFGILDYDFNILEGVIRDQFGDKGSKVAEEDVKSARAGFDYVRKEFDCHSFPRSLEPVDGPKGMFLTGNDAMALGAVKAGCHFYAAYPMTPASSILHTMASLQHDHGLVVKHVEDEISAVNMTIGAGYAGARAMCATSGGGFALMNEGYSLAGMTETPLVIAEVQRGGPATGIPTWTEQADLKFVLNAGHGEFPRFVIAPGDPEEAYYMTAEAFNIAEEFQTPVILLSDKYLAESNWTYPFFEGEVEVRRGPWVSDDELGQLEEAGERFKRYDLNTESGVSTRVVPGQHPNGIFTANSDEHEEHGYSCEEIDNRNAMSRKRLRKVESFRQSMPQPKIYGPEDADCTVVCWGSTKTMALQALDWLRDEGLSVNVLHLAYISPFPAEAVADRLNRAKLVLDVEHNATGQMADVIRMHTGLSVRHHLLKNDGRPILPEEVADKVRELLGPLADDKGVRS